MARKRTAANSIEKAMVPQDMGAANDSDLEVLIEDEPQEDTGTSLTENEDGSVTVDLAPSPAVESEEHDENLAEKLPEDVLLTLASDLLEDVAADLQSRSDWEKTYKEGLNLLGLKIEKRSEPWEGACGIVHPILTEAVVRFQAELISETFPPHGPVKTKLHGKITPEKEEAAARVRDDMNIELTDRMTEYRAEHERLLWNLPLSGSALKKVYYDPSLGRQTSMFVAAEDFIVSYGASDLTSCSRYTHVIRKTKNDLKKLQVAGFYRDIDLGEPVSHSSEIRDAKDKVAGQSAPSEVEHHTLYEVDVDLTIPGLEDPLDIDLPYIVTIDFDSQKVLGIRRNWKADDELRAKHQHFVHYQYIPGFGFYGFGLIHLVGGFAAGATSLLRQLVDAGTLSNLPGGLKTRGLRIKGDDSPIGPGEWRDVDVPGGTLKENLLPLPYKEPSVVLSGLLEKIVEEGRKFAAVAEMKIADFDSNSPVGTTMALLERTLKVMSSVQSRIYDAMKWEFRLIKGLIRDFGTDVYAYEPETGDVNMKAADYESVDVLPVADPNAATMSQRIVQWQAVMQLAAMAPQIYDLPELHARMLEILGVKEVDKLIPTRKSANQPLDPVSENMAIMNGKPVKAYITQDHKSHIAVHQMAMQDPKIMAMIGQNPMAQAIQAAAMAHLMEHLAFEYRAQMEQHMGIQLPAPDQPLPPEQEAQLSQLLSQAGQKLLAANQNEAAQAQAAEAAKDPVLQQQQRDSEIKEMEVARKSERDAWEKKIAELELQLKEKELSINAAAKGMQVGAQAAIHKDKMALEADKRGDAARDKGFTTAVDLTSKEKDREHQLALERERLASKERAEDKRAAAAEKKANTPKKGDSK